MDIHPWTRYEIARLRDEARLLRARDAALVAEARRARAGAQPETPPAASSWIDRVRRRRIAVERAPARTRAA